MKNYGNDGDMKFVKKRQKKTGFGYLKHKKGQR